MEDFALSVFEITDSLWTCFNKWLNDTLKEEFAKCGYSEEWLLDPANRERIHIGKYGFTAIATVDGVDLFAIESSGIEFDEETDKMYFIGYIKRYYEKELTNESNDI